MFPGVSRCVSPKIEFSRCFSRCKTNSRYFQVFQVEWPPCLICGNNLNRLLNWNLIYKTLWNGVRSGLLISMLGKLGWFHLTSLITLVLLIWKWMGLFLRKNNLPRCLGWPSLPNWIGALTLPLLLKLPPRKLEPLFILWSFFLPKMFCISTNLPYAHAWSTVVTSGLVPLVATWNC